MSIDAQMYLTKRFNTMPPDMVDMVWDMLPPSLRAEAEDKYEVLQGGVIVSEEYLKPVIVAALLGGINYSLYVRDIYNRCAY